MEPTASQLSSIEEQVVSVGELGDLRAGNGLPSVCAIMMARVRGPIAAATRSTVVL